MDKETLRRYGYDESKAGPGGRMFTTPAAKTIFLVGVGWSLLCIVVILVAMALT